MAIATKQFGKYESDGGQAEIGAIPIALQPVTGAGFANTQAFGAGTVANAAVPQTITGTGFANTSAFGSGSLSTQYAITGGGFANVNNFGAGTVSQISPQAIIGAGFVNLSQFGGGAISNGQTEDIDAVLPLFDRRTLKKLRKTYRQYSESELSDQRLRAKIREAMQPEAEQPESLESRELEAQTTNLETRELERARAPEIDWTLFDSVLAQLEAVALNRQKLLFMQQMEREQAIKQYEALVLAEFQAKLRAEQIRRSDNAILEMIIPILFDD